MREQRRTLVLGLLGISVLAIIIGWTIRPEARLLASVTRVPYAVLAVVIPSEANTRTELLEGIHARLTPSPVAIRSMSRQPRAILYVQHGSGAQSVVSPVDVFFSRDRSDLSGEPGVPWRGLYIFGDPAAIAVLQEHTPTASPLPAALWAGHHAMREERHIVFTRSAGIRTFVPFVSQYPLSDDTWHFLSWRQTDETLDLNGVLGTSLPDIEQSQSVLSEAGTSIIHLDGLPLSTLLPQQHRPPILSSLEAATGLSSQIEALLHSFGETPVSIHITTRGTEIMPVMVFRVPPSYRSAVHAALRELFRERLTHLHAQSVTTPSPQGTIHHLQPGDGEMLLEHAFSPDHLLLRAPCGAHDDVSTLPSNLHADYCTRTPDAVQDTPAGARDLIAEFQGSYLVLGGTTQSVRETLAIAVAQESSVRREVSFTLHLQDARDIPLFQHAVDTVTQHIPLYWRTATVTLRVQPHDDITTFEFTAHRQ